MPSGTEIPIGGTVETGRGIAQAMGTTTENRKKTCWGRIKRARAKRKPKAALDTRARTRRPGGYPKKRGEPADKAPSLEQTRSYPATAQRKPAQIRRVAGKVMTPWPEGPVGK